LERVELLLLLQLIMVVLLRQRRRPLAWTPTPLAMAGSGCGYAWKASIFPTLLGSNFEMMPASATTIQKIDAKIDEYKISLSDESEAFFTPFRLVE